ncbi:MAG: glycosyltransferase family 39 protein [Bacteroidales bacterium]|nr:glycosyltransferase family 39 protein [Bacteroidales bacterium]
MEINSVIEKISDLTETKGVVYFVFGLSAIIKISILIALSDKAINNDGLLYISAAQQFASGYFKEGLALYPMPLFSLLITAVHFVVHNWVVAGRFLSSTALLMALIPLYMLTSELFNRKAAFWACFLFSLAPVPNIWAVDIIRGPMFLFFFAWTIYFAQLSIKSAKLADLLLTVLFAWISILFRIEGIIFIPFYLLFLIGLAMVKPQERNALFKRILIWIAFPLIVLMIFIVFLGPEKMYFNRIDQAVIEAQNIFNFRFLDNYHRIYQGLKDLEGSSPFAGHGKQNLIAITRHYMSIIYLLGLLEGLIKVLFPLFVIPLYCGFKRPLSRNQVLILAFVASYLLMVYCYAIKVDFVRARFLFVPAFILYPWIGAGMERIFAVVNNSSRPKVFAFVFALIFLIAPISKTAYSFGKHDNVIVKSGEWLAGQPGFNNAKIVTNEMRILFYAGRETYADRGNSFEIYGSSHSDFTGIDKLAEKIQADVIIIITSVKKKDTMPELKYFKKIREFVGKKRIAVIFYSPDF